MIVTLHAQCYIYMVTTSQRIQSHVDKVSAVLQMLYTNSAVNNLQRVRLKGH